MQGVGVLFVGALLSLAVLPALAADPSPQLGKYTVELTQAEEKALLWDMLTIDDWLRNAIHEKARRTIDDITAIALSDTTGTVLSGADRQAVAAELSSRGIFLVGTVGQLPPDVKSDIVMRADIQSAADRQAEFEAGLP